eukprot:scaffold14625_cov125-Isochrysis_galbana.AAC.1
MGCERAPPPLRCRTRNSRVSRAGLSARGRGAWRRHREGRRRRGGWATRPAGRPAPWTGARARGGGGAPQGHTGTPGGRVDGRRGRAMMRAADPEHRCSRVGGDGGTRIRPLRMRTPSSHPDASALPPPPHHTRPPLDVHSLLSYRGVGPAR